MLSKLADADLGWAADESANSTEIQNQLEKNECIVLPMLAAAFQGSVDQVERGKCRFE